MITATESKDININSVDLIKQYERLVYSKTHCQIDYIHINNIYVMFTSALTI